jgi:hypothetical protein
MSQSEQIRPDSCPICQEPLPARAPGPGRPKTYCGRECRQENQRRVYRAKVDAEEQARREEYRRQWANVASTPFRDPLGRKS